MKNPTALAALLLLAGAALGVGLAPNTYWLYVLGMAGTMIKTEKPTISR